MRLIDADALRTVIKAFSDKLKEDVGYSVLHPSDVLYTIDNAPTIDAVEVVRCKDCKHWNEWENGTGSCQRSENAYFWFGTDLTDFCSFGERKTD